MSVALSIAAWTNGGSSYSGSFLDFWGRSEGQRGITFCGGTCRPVPDRPNIPFFVEKFEMFMILE
jgi:hypothetical protein